MEPGKRLKLSYLWEWSCGKTNISSQKEGHTDGLAGKDDRGNGKDPERVIL